MPIPDATREDVLDAMARFDAELRDTDGWLGWEERVNHKYAIEHEGKRYPVNQIVAMASNVGTQEFSGGDEANRWLRQRGLIVLEINSRSSAQAEEVTETNSNRILRDKRCWKISAGIAANYWEDFRDGGWIALDWGGSPDIRSLAPPSKDELWKQLNSLEVGNFSKIAAGQLWMFYRDLMPGDLVVVYGDKTIWGWGEISGEYTYAADSTNNRHRRMTTWRSLNAFSATELTPALAEHLVRPLALYELNKEEFETIVANDRKVRPASWWVNQGGSFEDEQAGGYIWADIVLQGGWTARPWKNVAHLRVGDIIVHSDGIAIRAIGLIEENPTVVVHPNSVDRPSATVPGNLVKVMYFPLKQELPISSVPLEWREACSGTFEPFAHTGELKPGYLFPLDREFLEKLSRDFSSQLPEAVTKWLSGSAAHESPEVSSVRTLVDELLPDPRTRRRCLNVLADAIERANSVSPSSWSVNLPRATRDVRLNVAWTQPCILGRRELVLVVDQNALSTVDLQTLGTALADDDRNRATYESVAEAAAFRAHLPEDRLDELLPLVIEPNLKFVELCASQVKTRAHRFGEHVPAVIDYLNQELGRKLPRHSGSRTVDSGVARIKGHLEPPFEDIVQAITKQGMRLDPRTLRRYHLALKTRGFVVLSGLSGTGKTWLAEAYARAVGAQHAVVAVAPNWTTNEDLLGYLNPLTGEYHHTTFSRFVGAAALAYQRASDAGVEPQPYHLVLDEMNLARVEYYFAQFLSAMEVRARHGMASIALGTDKPLVLPPNLFVIGTVNVDETTHGFADKVYDRAQLIELNARREDLHAHIADTDYRAEIMEMWDAVQHVGPFTFRVLDEVRAYVEASVALDADWEEALDEQFLQKVLPKLKGADPRVGDALAKVAAMCDERFPLSHAKAARMLEDFRSHGFASYFG